MPLEQLPPGATRRAKFDAVGGYAIHDAEYPHILISVIIVDSPYFATVDEKGSFSIAGVPDGKAHLEGLDPRQVGRRAGGRHRLEGRADRQGRGARPKRDESEKEAAE